MHLSRALVLNAAPDSGRLTQSAVTQSKSILGRPAIFDEAWLAEGEAWQALISADEGEDLELLRRMSAGTSGDSAIDVNIIAADLAFRRKKLLVADMESTIIEQELIDELADYVGLRDQISAITARAMRGELEFEGALRERVAMLKGLDARVLAEVYDRRVTLMPGAETLVRTMKANGAYCVLVSGGFTVFAERVAQRLGFDEHQANVLEIQNGTLTGRAKEPILGRAAKRDALLHIAKKRGIPIQQTLAVGDGANDLDMLAAAGLGVAFRAKPAVQAAARAMPNGAVITHGDLTALLYLQGYPKQEHRS